MTHVKVCIYGSCYGSGGCSPSSHPGGLGSFQGISSEFLWLTKQLCDSCLYLRVFRLFPINTHLQLYAAFTISDAVSRSGRHCTVRHFCMAFQASCRAEDNARDSLTRYCWSVLHRFRTNGGVVPTFCLLLHFASTRMAYANRPQVIVSVNNV